MPPIVKHANRSQGSSPQMTPQMISFGGAKGGVGRSMICAATAVALVHKGKRVLAIDLDLGSANLHTLLGVLQPKNNLERWLLGQEDRLEHICMPTKLKNLTLISSAASIFTLSDIEPDRLKRLIREARDFEVDYVLIDLGSGVSPQLLDLFNTAGRGLIVTTPEPTAIQNTFAFFKATLIRRIEVILKERPWLKKILSRAAFTQANGKIASLGEMLGMLRELDLEVNREVKAQLQGINAHLIINRSYPDDEVQVVHTLTEICSRYLHYTLHHTLTLSEDKKTQSGLRQLHPLMDLRELPFIKEIEAWVDQWLLQQPYTSLREECLDMIGSPALLSSQGIHSAPSTGLNWVATTTPEPTLTGIAGITAKTNSETEELLSVMSTISSPTQASENAVGLASEFASMTLKELEELTLQGKLHKDQLMAQPLSPSSSQFSDEEFMGDQDDSHVEPEPIWHIQMDDPPSHEVTSLEEEVKTPEGWLHLKTSDLAPFRPVIQVSIYRDGLREVMVEESYEGLHASREGTHIEKKVERIHFENARLLNERGLSGWWAAQT